jgi:hypothetical protein
MNPVWLDAVVLLMDGPALCRGVVVNPTGVVATAYHCVANGDAPRVELRDGTRLRGQVIARDPVHDLALVRVDRGGLTSLAVRADDPLVGERVYGMGHPYGTAAGGRLEGLLRWSVSEGIVSAVGPWMIQTDAALNPGSSGGPVVDTEGRVVGIASRKLRADNLAFLAKGADLDALVRSGEPGPWIGGSYGIGPGFSSAHDEVWLGVGGWIAVRDRVVERIWVVASPGVLDSLGGVDLVDVVAVRQRVGNGAFSTTFDAGVGFSTVEGVAALMDGRITLGLLGVGARWWPATGDGGVTIDVGWPGLLGVF